MSKLYLEEKGAMLLKQLGMSKTEFALKMGVRKQNVNVLFKTKNIDTISRISVVLNIPLELLIGYVSEPTLPYDSKVIENKTETVQEEDIPTGNNTVDRRKRQGIITAYYQEWKRNNPEQKKYNVDLKDDINIRSVSVIETAAQASLTYLSTLAVLQLDAILTNSRLVKKVRTKAESKNQRPFESILIMEYVCTGIGRIKMTVGVRRSDKKKIQYCITAIDAYKIKQEG